MKREFSDRFTAIPALILDIDVMATGTDRLLRIPAKIDTGADISVIPESVVRQLRIIWFGQRTLHAVAHPAFAALTYWGTLVVESHRFDIEMATHDRSYALIGRDILNQFILFADGPAEIFELRWPRASVARTRRRSS